MLPLYLEKLTLPELHQRAEALHQLMVECRICPNECMSKRTEGETGDCHSTDEVIISSVGPHFGEEPPLVGTNGSGTIFFTNCNLSCEFCQNYDISHLGKGEKVTKAELARAMRQLQRSEEHTSELQSHLNLVCRLLLEKKKKNKRGTECTRRSRWCWRQGSR